MAQKHNAEYAEKPMTRDGRIQGPSRRYRRLRHPIFPAAEWTAKNPLLQRGEIGFEIDTHKAKVGDGVTYWNDLPYSFVAETEWGSIVGDIADQTDLKNALDAKQDVLTAGTNINITGNNISATDTTYTGSDGITLTGTNFTNSGVRGVATGASNGTISVNTNGTSADVAVYGLGSAAYTASSDYATSAQGSLADTAVQPADLANYVTTNTTQTITGEKVFSGIMNYSAGKTYILAGNGGTKLGYWSYDIDGQSNITLQTMTASTRNINFKTNNGGKVTYNGSEIAKLSDLPGVMTGASAGDAGTSGLVPAPAAGDQAKFLKGDGTWDAPTASAAWGAITGTLSDQTDLQSALNAKQDTLTAGTNISISGNTISATDTTYTGSDGITLTGTNFTNSGVRAVASGTANGTISVNTNGTSADVAVTGLGSAAYTASTDYATAAQGTKADTAVQPGDLATVATSGDYGDLLNKPTIPTVNDATLTIQKNGTTVNTFTANASSNVTANITVPTKISDLTNDSNFADTDLSNLTDTGKNIGNWSSNVTNCITNIPQDIKLELNSGTLTLKAGSKVYVPNGAGVFDVVNITNDLNYFYSDASHTSSLFYNRTTNTLYGETSTGSGTGTNPPQAYYTYYNTSLNIIRRSTNGTTWLDDNMSLPLCIFKSTQGVGITSIDQVFNGFGYIGSTVFALPGVKALIPNGKNADGTLKNTEVSVSTVKTSTLQYDSEQIWSFTTSTGSISGDTINPGQSVYFVKNLKNMYGLGITSGYNKCYVEETNLWYQNQNTSTWTVVNMCLFAHTRSSSLKITSFNSKTDFHAVDYNDTDFIAHQAMPSDRYVNLTLGASGTTYTAPADGYVTLIKEATSAQQYIEMSTGQIFGNMSAIYNGQLLYSTIPVSKGATFQINYNAGGSTNKFGFSYANGAQ